MQLLRRKTRTFSLDEEVLDSVETTKGQQSASERVNSLLKFALRLERKAALNAEAMAFYSDPEEQEEREAFRNASISSVTRDE